MINFFLLKSYYFIYIYYSDLLEYFLKYPILIYIIKIICILISVAYFTIAERKIMASIQRRRGPNVEGGIFGILQPLADGLKLFIKELVIPGRANIFVYFLAPILIFTLSLTGWFLIPFNVENNFVFVAIKNYEKSFGFLEYEMFFLNKPLWETPIVRHMSFYNTEYSILFILAISSLNVYGIILSGWASNSKYAFLGSLRSAAQMISYEVSIGLTVLPVILFSQSFNFVNIVNTQAKTIWFCFPFLPCAIIFLISMLAETNRAPFDLPEAEAELVAGYNVEYAGMLFALFFLGEYSSMLLMAALGIILFFGGWTIPFFEPANGWVWFNSLIFALKIAVFCFFYIIVRATFPRYRYSQLMTIGWKIFLPLSLAFFFFCSCIFATFFFDLKVNQNVYLLNFCLDLKENLNYYVIPEDFFKTSFFVFWWVRHFLVVVLILFFGYFFCMSLYNKFTVSKILFFWHTFFKFCIMGFFIIFFLFYLFIL